MGGAGDSPLLGGAGSGIGRMLMIALKRRARSCGLAPWDGLVALLKRQMAAMHCSRSSVRAGLKGR